ncbi:MAG: ECF transporter S component [Clostridia bacterium]|nr:ECF transporter S component [Clostridia bacterium]
MQKGTQTERIRKLTLLAILTAIVFVLQFFFSSFRLGGFSVATVLLPIVIGAAFCGPLSGAWLGLVFAGAVFLSGDAAFFLTLNPFGTVVTVVLKGVLAGLVTGLVYRLLERYNRYLAVTVSAVVCPLVNTGVFVLGCFLFFYEPIAGFAGAEGMNVWAYILTFYVTFNFVFEMLFNIVFCPIITRLLSLRRK